MLTPKQQRFVSEYLIDLNATQAATRAGYSAKTAEQQGYQLLQKTSVAEAVAVERAKLEARTGITQDYVLTRLKENVERAMQAVAILGDEGAGTGIYRYEGSVANRALELLGKHLGMFAEKVEHGGSVGITGPVTVIVKARAA